MLSRSGCVPCANRNSGVGFCLREKEWKQLDLKRLANSFV
jgi:hypothetical protein